MPGAGIALIHGDDYQSTPDFWMNLQLRWESYFAHRLLISSLNGDLGA
jgi:plasmid maintenance system antidote protein VapI